MSDSVADDKRLEDDVAAVGRIGAVPTILDVVCSTTGMRFAAVARVTADRWIACSVRDDIAFGLRPGSELKVETTICDAIRDTGTPVIIDHVAQDPAYRDHLTPQMYGFQSYISMPIIRADGTFFGTLCAIDPRPARLSTPEIIGMFKLFAELISFHLEQQERVADSEARLRQERQDADLREQFIAVLGHDLRNPLAAIGSGAELLAMQPLDEKASRIVSLIQRSAFRMADLIEHVMDFAHERLGDGLSLDRQGTATLAPVLEEVVGELSLAWPDRAIETRFSITRPVECDHARIAQLFSNLLANALTHGAPDAPVTASASTENGVFELTVANQGEPIPPAITERLFQPFFRASVRENQQGLGLGLYIASAIARAHGGTLAVTSTAEETCFTFRMRALSGEV